MMRICDKIKKIDVNKRYKISIIILILIGVAIRVIGIAHLPDAINVDEISSGYEAFSIANYGIDRNGNFMPVFLKAWGSGQNALLTYLIIPFIYIVGLNVLAIRLPMAIISSISVVIMYLILKRIANPRIARIGLAFFVICPWHIMKSRWGLESNLFPDLILLSVFFIIKGLEDNKKPFYYSGFVIAGISAYAYGTSYLFLPVFIIPLLIILYKQKKITIIQGLVSLGIVTIIALPIILYVLINTFDLPQINLPFMTIPKLEVNRFQSITSISFENIKEAIPILLLQDDGLDWNAIDGFGVIYMLSIAFTVMGVVRNFCKKSNSEIKYSWIFNLWFIAAICIIPICEPNINRLNIIFIPIIYYTILGIDFICQKKQITYAVIAMYVISFILFMYTYIMQDSNKLHTFEDNLKEPISYISNLEDKQIHITDKIKEPYIYVLFYTKYNTKEFVETVEYDAPDMPFRQVISFGNYHFEDISELENNENNVYMIEKADKELYDLEGFKVTDFESYVVIEGVK